MNQSIAWSGKGNDRVRQIKVQSTREYEEALEGCAMKDLKRISLSDQKV